ncbi:hypothetical protein [Kitasatospora sp. NPDC057223]|uniref:hypothetical protein n=1 Tax=Kitasatospora sp. NPDC057223 TaxID=3346055 RepID=UPI00362654F5
MRVRMLSTVAAVAVAVVGSTAGRVADSNDFADFLLARVNERVSAPVGLQEFTFVVKGDRITSRDFSGTLRCTVRFDLRRMGDSAPAGWRNGKVVTGFHAGFQGTRVSCEGTVKGDTVAGRPRKTSVDCRTAREGSVLVEATGTTPNRMGGTLSSFRLLALSLTCSASPPWKLSRSRADTAFQAVTKDIRAQMTDVINKRVAAAFSEAVPGVNMPDPARH